MYLRYRKPESVTEHLRQSSYNYAVSNVLQKDLIPVIFNFNPGYLHLHLAPSQEQRVLRYVRFSHSHSIELKLQASGKDNGVFLQCCQRALE
jgi:hypothetical protein